MKHKGGHQQFKLHAVARGHDRRGLRRGVSLLPSLFTLANLFCGFWSIILAFNGNFKQAGWFIVYAGILARRIVCRLKGGEQVSAGQRYGVMKFGSRIDLFIPRTATIHPCNDFRRGNA